MISYKNRRYNKKTINKIVDIIRKCKNLEYIIEQSKESKKLDKVNKISHKDCKLQTTICKTAKKLVFKCYLLYYKYKKQFYNYLIINSSTFIEFE